MELKPIGEKIFKKDRWYVRTVIDGKRATIPLANATWLESNPSFNGIPKGYVIHHLDHNQLNDDPSNLALVGKNLHRAYHLKYKFPDQPVNVKDLFDNASIDKNLISYRIPRIKKSNNGCTIGSIHENKSPKGSKYIVRFRSIFRRFDDLGVAEDFLKNLRAAEDEEVRIITDD